MPPPEVRQLAGRLSLPENARDTLRPVDDPLTRVVVDPYANAIHVSLLREKQLNPVYARELEEVGVGSAEMHQLRATLLAGGPVALATPEKLRIMSDAESMAWLHSRVWTLPQQWSDHNRKKTKEEEEASAARGREREKRGSVEREKACLRQRLRHLN